MLLLGVAVQQSSIKKKIYGSAFGEELYTKCLSFLLNLK